MNIHLLICGFWHLQSIEEVASWKKGGGASTPAPVKPEEQNAADAAANRLTTFRPDGSKAVEYGYIGSDGNFVAGAPSQSKLPQYAVASYESDFEKGIRESQEGAASELAQNVANNVGTLAMPPTYDPNGSEVAQTIYDRTAGIARRDIEQSRRRLDNTLQARGLAPGSEAYNRAMTSADETEQETWANLAKDAYLAGQGEARSDYAAKESERASRLNELAGLIGGSYAPGAVSAPTGGAALSGGQAYVTNYNQQMQAAQAAAAQQQAQNASIGSALGSGAALAGGLLAKCHSRFKMEIEPLKADEIVELVEIFQWRYRPEEGDSALHASPMAEHFHALTGLGDPENLNPIDMCAVLWSEVQKLQRRIADLEER